VTNLPDWLVERVALDEVAPASRPRLEQADPSELADRVAAIHTESSAELAAYPADVAVTQLETRIASEAKRRATRRRNRRLGLIGVMGGAVAVVTVVGFSIDRTKPADHAQPSVEPDDDGIRVKGPTRLRAFRLSGDHVERLEQDAVVRAGDLIQLRYHAGGRNYGVIASVDGAGTVTLHHPASEDAPPEATVLAARTTALPHAYALDDAPRFERFFFITADEPIDLQQSLASLRALARRADSATASLELPAGLRQWSLRLRKPDSKSPTP